MGKFLGIVLICLVSSVLVTAIGEIFGTPAVLILAGFAFLFIACCPDRDRPR